MQKANNTQDKGYARCKGCNHRFYPAVNENIPGGFEDLCSRCLGIATNAARVDPVLYFQQNNELQHPDAWDQDESDQSDKRFIDGWLMDKLGGPNGDLWKEDEYLEGGEGAFGDLGLFDKYE